MTVVFLFPQHQNRGSMLRRCLAHQEMSQLEQRKKVEKVLNDKFEIVHGNEYVLNFGELEICIKKSKGELIEGDSKIEIKGKHTEVVDGTHVTDSAGEMTLRAPRIDLN